MNLFDWIRLKVFQFRLHRYQKALPKRIDKVKPFQPSEQAVIALPNDWTPEQIEEYKNYFNEVLSRVGECYLPEKPAWLDDPKSERTGKN